MVWDWEKSGSCRCPDSGIKVPREPDSFSAVSTLPRTQAFDLNSGFFHAAEWLTRRLPRCRIKRALAGWASAPGQPTTTAQINFCHFLCQAAESTKNRQTSRQNRPLKLISSQSLHPILADSQKMKTTKIPLIWENIMV